MPLSPHTRLGPYEIVSAIGAGGMGEVYKARDTRLDRIVAIKVLHEHRHSTPQARERFEREAKAISSLSHPHICTLHDVGHQDGIDYLVMEYLEGQTLADRLKKGALPVEQVLQHAIQIADALDAAHKRGVIHRDLKPGNIMLTKTGVKLLDFGLAKIHAVETGARTSAIATQTTPLTGERSIIGTLQYMAPEQLEGKDSDARTDIFALGAVIYEMTTGQRAFEGKSQASLISAIMTSEPPAISTLKPSASGALDHVSKTCLAKDPDNRWQSAGDLRRELQWIARGDTESSKVAHTVSERTSWIALCVCLIALVALSVIHFGRKPPRLIGQTSVRFFVHPPANTKFVDQPVSVSPDGKKVAFVAEREGEQPVLWVRSLDSTEAISLQGTEEASGPFWSPDSRFLAFFTPNKLKRIEATGGIATVVCQVSGGTGGTWSLDAIVFGVFGDGLYRVSPSGVWVSDSAGFPGEYWRVMLNLAVNDGAGDPARSLIPH